MFELFEIDAQYFLLIIVPCNALNTSMETHSLSSPLLLFLKRDFFATI